MTSQGVSLAYLENGGIQGAPSNALFLACCSLGDNKDAQLIIATPIKEIFPDCIYVEMRGYRLYASLIFKETRSMPAGNYFIGVVTGMYFGYGVAHEGSILYRQVKTTCVFI